MPSLRVLPNILAAAALPLLVSSAAAAAGVLLAPPALDLGEWAAGRTTGASAWLINAGDRPVRLTGVRAEGDRIAVRGVRPQTLPPSGAVELRVTIEAATSEGETLTRHVTATFAAGPPLVLPVRVSSIHPDVHLPPPDARHAGLVVRPASPMVDFGELAPGARATRPVWLVNTGTAPATLLAAKGSCGCLELPTFAPRRIGPGRATEITATMIGEGEVGRERFKYVTLLIEGHEPVILHARAKIIDINLARLHRYLDALARHDTAAMRVHLSLDSRIWIGTPEGPGRRRQPDGTAPWSGWDRVMNTERRHEGFEVDGAAITATMTETDDLRRLLEAPPRRTRVTYLFDDDRAIEGVLLRPEPEDPTFVRRFEDVRAWARRHRAAALVDLAADGSLHRDAETAERWRRLLLDWRRATGLPPVLKR